MLYLQTNISHLRFPRLKGFLLIKFHKYSKKHSLYLSQILFQYLWSFKIYFDNMCVLFYFWNILRDALQYLFCYKSKVFNGKFLILVYIYLIIENEAHLSRFIRKESCCLETFFVSNKLTLHTLYLHSSIKISSSNKLVKKFRTSITWKVSSETDD